MASVVPRAWTRPGCIAGRLRCPVRTERGEGSPGSRSAAKAGRCRRSPPSAATGVVPADGRGAAARRDLAIDHAPPDGTPRCSAPSNPLRARSTAQGRHTYPPESAETLRSVAAQQIPWHHPSGRCRTRLTRRLTPLSPIGPPRWENPQAETSRPVRHSAMFNGSTHALRPQPKLCG